MVRAPRRHRLRDVQTALIALAMAMGLEHRVRLLDLELAHLSTYAELPLYHRDPFDRLLVAQAKAEDLAVLTSDERFSAYGVETHW